LGGQQAKVVASTANRAAMIWAAGNTPASSHFPILTGNAHLFNDPTMEWFPVFAQQASIGTLQGKVWQYGNVFYAEMSKIQAVQSCYFKDPGCLKNKSASIAKVDYFYLTKTCTELNTCGPLARQPGPLALQLLAAQDRYPLVFENQDISIFKVK
jgi:hypothetical protein